MTVAEAERWLSPYLSYDPDASEGLFALVGSRACTSLAAPSPTRARILVEMYTDGDLYRPRYGRLQLWGFAQVELRQPSCRSDAHAMTTCALGYFSSARAREREGERAELDELIVMDRDISYFFSQERTGHGSEAE